MANDNKKNFEWKEGQVLHENNSKHLGGVYVKGSQKIAQSVPVEQKQRLAERQEQLEEAKAKTYEEKVRERKRNPPPEEEPSFIIEETHSGVSGDFAESEAKKIFDRDADSQHQFQGIGRRFGSPPKPKK